MTDESNDSPFSMSRRKLLGAAGTVGAAGALGGAATSSLLWDEEKFGTANNPNVLQAGELDLKVDWEVKYYDWRDSTDRIVSTSDGADDDDEPDMVDQPGPIIELQDIKPGDVVEATLSAHVFGNPAFLGGHTQPHGDAEGDNPEPEQEAGSEPDPERGDLNDLMEVVIWYDDGDNLPNEVMDVPESTEEYVMDVAAIQDAEEAFGGAESVIYAGPLATVPSDLLFKASMSNSTDTSEGGTDGDDNLKAEEFSDYCYEASATEYIAMLAWVPRDIPVYNDNVIQGDSFEFQFGFDAIQCRHNVANDGTPIDDTIGEADAENNAQSPGGD